MSNKIFIVDDEPDLLKVLQYRLENKGFETVLCSHGGIAYDEILKGEFGLVLMDFFMPGLKGDEVCSSIRQEESLKELPIIIMTAADNYTPEFFLERGATDVLFKPIDTDLLLEKVNRYLPSD